MRICYEASSCGFGLQRALHAHGILCEVIAPSSIPSRSGERIKTDRRVARKLATLYAAGLLTPICVPDADQEALRSLVRCRTSLVDTKTRVKQQILAFLQTRGFRYPGRTSWTKMFHTWLDGLSFVDVDQNTMQTYLHQLAYLNQEIGRLEEELTEIAARDRYRLPVQILMAFRGMGLVTALTVICELGDVHRFAHARQVMAYLGLVPSEHSSGSRTQRGSITKTGNRHVRKAIMSTAWKYTAPPRCSKKLRKCQEGLPPEVIAFAWKAQQRLYKRFYRLSQIKSRCVANTAVARELARFLWEALRRDTPRSETT